MQLEITAQFKLSELVQTLVFYIHSEPQSLFQDSSISNQWDALLTPVSLLEACIISQYLQTPTAITVLTKETNKLTVAIKHTKE